MVKNNIKAFLIHIFVALVCYEIIHFKVPIMVKFINTRYMGLSDYRRADYIFGTFVLIVAVILYYILGKKFLKRREKISENIVSVILVGIVGVFAWKLSWRLLIGGNNYLSFYYSYAETLIEETMLFSARIVLLISFIPSIVMFLAITFKGNKLKISGINKKVEETDEEAVLRKYINVNK